MTKLKKARTGTPVDSTKSNLKGVSRNQMLSDMNKAAKGYNSKKAASADSIAKVKSTADRPSWKKMLNLWDSKL